MYKQPGSDYMMDPPMSYGGRSSFMGGGDKSFGLGGNSFGGGGGFDSLAPYSDFSKGGGGGSDFYSGDRGGMGMGMGGGLGGASRGRGVGPRGGGPGRGSMRGGGPSMGQSRGRGGYRGGGSGPGAAGGRGGGSSMGRGGGQGTQRGGTSQQGTSKPSRAGTESGYLQDHKGHFPDEFWCKTCNAKTTGPENYKAHLSGTRHKQNMKNLANGESVVRTGPLSLRKRKLDSSDGPAQKKTLDQMLQDVTDPIVGLEYVTEIVREGNIESTPDYDCELCTCRTLQGNIIYHLIGFRHRMAYITKHKPELAEIIETSAKTEVAAEEKPNGDEAAPGTAAAQPTPEEEEEKRKRASRSKLSEKVKEFIHEVAAGCQGKKYKVKRIKEDNIGLPPAKKSVPMASAKNFSGQEGGRGRGRGGGGGSATPRGRGSYGGRGGPSNGGGGPRSYGGGLDGPMGGRGGGGMSGRGGGLGGFSRSGPPPARGSYSSPMGVGRGLDEDLGGGRGRGFGDYDDLLGGGPSQDLGGYDLSPGPLPSSRRDLDVESIKSEILDSLKRESVVSDAFILREFERRFGVGTGRRPRGDLLDDLDHDRRDPPPLSRDPLGFPRDSITGEQQDSENFADVTYPPSSGSMSLPPMPTYMETPQSLGRTEPSRPSKPPLKSCLKKTSYAMGGVERLTSQQGSMGQSGMGSSSSQPMHGMFSSLPPADSRLANQATEMLTNPMSMYENRQVTDRSDSLGGYDSPRGRSLLPPPLPPQPPVQPPMPPYGGLGPGYTRL